MTALFDFDGTLVPERNSLFWHFVRALPARRWRVAKTAAFVQGLGGLIGPAAVRVLDHDRMYKLLVVAVFGGLPVDQAAVASERLAGRIDAMVFPAMRPHLESRDGPRYLVTSNAEPIVSGFCARQGLECVATRLHVAGGRYTGLLAGELNAGYEKVARLRELGVPLDDAVAYGNSIADHEMLRAVPRPVLVDPSPELEQRFSAARAPRIATRALAVAGTPGG